MSGRTVMSLGEYQRRQRWEALINCPTLQYIPLTKECFSHPQGCTYFLDQLLGLNTREKHQLIYKQLQFFFQGFSFTCSKYYFMAAVTYHTHNHSLSRTLGSDPCVFGVTSVPSTSTLWFTILLSVSVF